MNVERDLRSACRGGGPAEEKGEGPRPLPVSLFRFLQPEGKAAAAGASFVHRIDKAHRRYPAVVPLQGQRGGEAAAGNRHRGTVGQRIQLPRASRMGLSIVKHAAAYHNAAVSLESAEGKGTTVTVRWR